MASPVQLLMGAQLIVTTTTTAIASNTNRTSGLPDNPTYAQGIDRSHPAPTFGCHNACLATVTRAYIHKWRNDRASPCVPYAAYTCRELSKQSRQTDLIVAVTVHPGDLSMHLLQRCLPLYICLWIAGLKLRSVVHRCARGT
jgi:hypothetical protein